MTVTLRSQFFHLQNENNGINPIGMLQELNELKYMKCLVHSMCSIKVQLLSLLNVYYISASQAFCIIAYAENILSGTGSRQRGSITTAYQPTLHTGQKNRTELVLPWISLYWLSPVLTSKKLTFLW